MSSIDRLAIRGMCVLSAPPSRLSLLADCFLSLRVPRSQRARWARHDTTRSPRYSRSFDMNEMNVIQFFHPLTVIVGHNGSGKTVRGLWLLHGHD